MKQIIGGQGSEGRDNKLLIPSIETAHVLIRVLGGSLAQPFNHTTKPLQATDGALFGGGNDTSDVLPLIDNPRHKGNNTNNISNTNRQNDAHTLNNNMPTTIKTRDFFNSDAVYPAKGIGWRAHQAKGIGWSKSGQLNPACYELKMDGNIFSDQATLPNLDEVTWGEPSNLDEVTGGAGCNNKDALTQTVDSVSTP